MKRYASGLVLWLVVGSSLAQNSYAPDPYRETSWQVTLPLSVSGECIVRYSEILNRRYEIRITLEDVQSLTKTNTDLDQSKTEFPRSHPRIEAARMLEDIRGRPKHESGCWAVSGTSREFRRVFAFLLMAGRSSVRNETDGGQISSALLKSWTKGGPHGGVHGGIIFSSEGLVFFHD